MPIEFLSQFGVRSLIWITSLDDDEMEMTTRVVEELDKYFRTISLAFAYHRVRNLAEFYALLDGIAEAAREGARPMIHFDMHGNKEGLGIKPGNGDAEKTELASWEEVIPKLQTINVATRGNLCVIAGVCYALHAIRQIKIHQPCAVHILIAPEEKVYVDFLDESTVGFYQELFSIKRVEAAHENHLSEQLKVFYSEKLLLVALARYIKNDCRGQGGEERKKRLFEESMRNLPDTPENRNRVRQALEGISRPDQALVDKYAKIFLAGRACPFSIDDLMRIVEQAETS
jgi:hypothetical protein